MGEERLRVLVVEDDMVDRMAFERFMKAGSIPYDYVFADTLKTARDALSTHKFDIVVTDYVLPDGTSLEIFERIGETPIIVVTGSGDEATAVEAMKRGAYDYLIKDPEGNYLQMLPATVENAIRHKRIEDELKRYRKHLEALVKERTAALEEEIKERERAEEGRQELQEQLHQSQKMEAMGELAAGVAHDFNNLLTVIMGNAEMIESVLPEGSLEGESLRMISQASEQAMGVTRSMLTFSRRVPTKRRPVELQRVVEDACRFLDRVLPASIDLIVDADCGQPLWIDADKTQIQQVIMNLAINARDAMPDGGTLRVSLSPVSQENVEASGASPDQSEPRARLVVSDTGTGISPELEPRVFEPFYTTKSRGRGTGLGLSIVHGIVENHGGRIDVQSEVGQGATFTLILPCTLPGTATDTDERAVKTPRGRGETILLAEDHEFVRQVVAMMLRQLGYEVIAVTNGPELLERYRSHRERIQLLVMDIDLPGRNGLDCLADIRSTDVHTPVIMITGYADAKIEGRLDSNTTLLLKPFKESELGTWIDRALRGEHNPAERSDGGVASTS